MRRRLFFFGTLLTVFLANNVQSQGSQTVNNGAATTLIDFTKAGCFYTWVNDTPGIGLAANGQGSIPSFTAVNTGSGPVTATITATLVTPAAYIGDESDSTITVVNIANQQIITTLKLPGAPDNIAVSPDGSKVYVTSGTYNPKAFGMVIVISTFTNQVVANIPLTTNNPGGIVVSADGSKLYISDDISNLITTVNARTYQAVGTTTINSAGPLCISPDGTTLYVANVTGNYVNIIRTTDMSVVTTIPVGQDPVAMVITPDGSKVYVSNYVSGSVSVINTSSKTIEATLQIGYFSLYMSMSPDGSAVYVGSGNGSASFLSTINTATNSIANTLHLNPQPYGMCLTPDGSQIYINDSNNNYTTVVDTKSYSTVATITTGIGPFSPGTFISGGVGCSSEPLKYTITVNPGATNTLPQISTGPVTGAISACEGSTTESPTFEQFTVLGENMTDVITVTAPPNFEVSVNPDGDFGPSLSLIATDGTVDNAVVYVRSIGSTTPGSISGVVTLSSTGAATKTVPTAGTIYPLPVVNTVAGQTVAAGALTSQVDFTGTGTMYTWVNDMPGIGLPGSGTGDIAPFTALNNGKNLLTANITVTPVSTISGCTGSPVSFAIKVTPHVVIALVIPNTFTPNGDGVNDTWDIKYISAYPQCSVRVFNRWGQNVYTSTGYGTPWNGAYGGSPLPAGTYYYVIDLNNNTAPLAGFVAIVR
jgi:gliding motility-associated-like protein